MLRRMLLVFGLSILASLSAQAQDKAELTAVRLKIEQNQLVSVL